MLQTLQFPQTKQNQVPFDKVCEDQNNDIFMKDDSVDDSVWEVVLFFVLFFHRKK